MSAPLLYRVYVAATALLLPFTARREGAKLRAAGFSKARAHEKRGYASLPRPDAAPLIWFHAASVGESLSVLALITRLGQRLPSAQFLITSGTATSADLLSRRLPPRTRHQFAPLDAPGPVRRFLRHWQPDAAVFVESELWPHMLRRAHLRGVKLALVNARLSDRSLAGWAKRPRMARHIMEVFSLILTQNDRVADGLLAMQADPDVLLRGVNLKSMSAPLPVDAQALAQLRAQLNGRPVWVASSTHEGEEASVLAAHRTLLAQYPDLCLILAPRHPERGEAVRDLIAGAGMSYTRRTRGEALGGQVYLADTLGELGLWYALSDVVFLGGSLKPIGGHNPFEVAQAGAMTLSGNHVANFAETFAEMEAQGAALLIADAQDIAGHVGRLLSDPQARSKAVTAALAFVSDRADTLDHIATRLITDLELPA